MQYFCTKMYVGIDPANSVMKILTIDSTRVSNLTVFLILQVSEFYCKKNYFFAMFPRDL